MDDVMSTYYISNDYVTTGFNNVFPSEIPPINNSITIGTSTMTQARIGAFDLHEMQAKLESSIQAQDALFNVVNDLLKRFGDVEDILNILKMSYSYSGTWEKMVEEKKQSMTE